jgi:phosphatidyl-myo-inositol dimannoside synthase
MDILISQDFFPEIGGAHKWLYEVYKRWPSKVKAIVQDYSSDSSLRDAQFQFDSANKNLLDIIRYNLRIDDVNIRDHNFIKKVFNISRLLNRTVGKNQGTIHCLRAFPEAIPAIFLKKFSSKNIRVVTYAHGEEILTAQTSRQLLWFTKWVFKNSDLIIANSRFTGSLVAEITSNDKIAVINPGVDTQSFDIDENSSLGFRNTFGWPEDTIILTTIARMEPRKNHLSVIQAVAGLRREGLPLAYIIGSDGPERETLRSAVRHLKIDEYVKFTGYLSEKDRVLTFASADIHVMPSIQVDSMIEGYGIVFLEAAAAATPSVSGNTGGQLEAILDGKTGIAVDGANIHQLAEAIKKLALSPNLREKMGQAGRLWARENDWERVAEKTFTHIRQLK